MGRIYSELEVGAGLTQAAVLLVSLGTAELTQGLPGTSHWLGTLGGCISAFHQSEEGASFLPLRNPNWGSFPRNSSISQLLWAEKYSSLSLDRPRTKGELYEEGTSTLYYYLLQLAPTWDKCYSNSHIPEPPGLAARRVEIQLTWRTLGRGTLEY